MPSSRVVILRPSPRPNDASASSMAASISARRRSRRSSAGTCMVRIRNSSVELVSYAPVGFLAGLDANVVVGFGADGGSNGPEHQFRDRPIAGLTHARAGLGILHA